MYDITSLQSPSGIDWTTYSKDSAERQRRDVASNFIVKETMKLRSVDVNRQWRFTATQQCVNWPPPLTKLRFLGFDLSLPKEPNTTQAHSNSNKVGSTLRAMVERRTPDTDTTATPPRSSWASSAALTVVAGVDDRPLGNRHSANVEKRQNR